MVVGVAAWGGAGEVQLQQQVLARCCPLGVLQGGWGGLMMPCEEGDQSVRVCGGVGWGGGGIQTTVHACA